MERSYSATSRSKIDSPRSGRFVATVLNPAWRHSLHGPIWEHHLAATPASFLPILYGSQPIRRCLSSRAIGNRWEGRLSWLLFLLHFLCDRLRRLCRLDLTCAPKKRHEYQ